MTRSFKTKGFARFAKREGLPDTVLCRAAEMVERGLIDADLGGGVVKLRLARPGQGKSGGAMFRRRGRVVFVFGYAKSSRSGIDAPELTGFRLLAKHVLAMSADEVARAVEAGALVEVGCDGEGCKALRQ